jgi:hypothetical protein
MATLNKKNETVGLPLFKNGVSLQLFKVTFPSDVSAKLDTDYTNYSNDAAKSPVAGALDAIGARVSVEVLMPLQTGGTVLPIAVAALGGDYPSDNYDGTSGNETMAAYLQTLVQAVGARQGVASTTTTVTSGWPAIS